ncbi:1-acyl-sn-glycerol-3-phosphate acyltransferase [Candidatus Phytoplasma luffae]|uniref:1-acyl-sn-glycerol-3-phosphate acyltransferase n=1 Tax=Loofah witches'-broom phytoplasma TaxID=35773 RepID=A0A975IM65_LOWBP|nr:lysophospholipid acyltransferase family protein [Candidatus Phytoplasma luffae]QTX03187.1 1-acyl-sn-glycerol-3-phosphate acyltransferase [Candidatus Phytoplasma luffae]
MFTFILFFYFFFFMFCSSYLVLNFYYLPDPTLLKSFVTITSFILSFFINLILSWVCVLFFLFIAMWFSKKLKVDHPLRNEIISSFSKLIMNFFRIKVIIHNKELIPLKNKLVIYSNHKTNFDPFIIASIFPRTIAFTPKSELYDSRMGWFLSYCFNASNCIKIKRENNKETVKNIMQGIQNIKNNLGMIIFNEGGIKHKTSDKIINSLDGSFKIILKSEADVLPITLKGSCAMRGKCWFRRKKVEIFIHKALHFEELQNNNTKEINQKVTNIINSVL